jgi:GTP cyclohydrolase I
MRLGQDIREYIFLRYTGKTPLADAIATYENMPSFKINENIHDTGISSELNYNEDVHQVMRLASQYHMTEVFKAMKVDLDDPNVEEVSKVGNIGTPGRLIKMWTGSNTHDDRELLSGRWASKPRIASFPNDSDARIPITKRVDLTAVCSHHLAPFSTTFREEAYAVISYIPDKRLLGISKLPRMVNFISQRGWLQEGLTKAIYDEITQIAETDSVYVKLSNVVHTCESLRGAKTKEGTFTSEYYGGAFADPELRRQIN